MLQRPIYHSSAACVENFCNLRRRTVSFSSEVSALCDVDGIAVASALLVLAPGDLVDLDVCSSVDGSVEPDGSFGSLDS